MESSTRNKRNALLFPRCALIALACLFVHCASSQEPAIERISPEEAAESLGKRALSKEDGLGCIEGNCENGKGTYVYTKKIRYSGEFTNGERNGQGTVQYENGDRYTGGFSAGKRSGQGKYFFANGDIYDGEFSKGKRAGKGVYSFASGGVFEGEFVNDGRSGQGRFHPADGKSAKPLDCELRDYSLYCLVEGNSSLVKKLRGNTATPQAQSPPRSYFEGNR